MNKDLEKLFEHYEKLFLESNNKSGDFTTKKDYENAYIELGKQNALLEIRIFILNLSKNENDNKH